MIDIRYEDVSGVLLTDWKIEEQILVVEYLHY